MFNNHDLLINSHFFCSHDLHVCLEIGILRANDLLVFLGDKRIIFHFLCFSGISLSSVAVQCDLQPSKRKSSIFWSILFKLFYFVLLRITSYYFVLLLRIITSYYFVLFRIIYFV